MSNITANIKPDYSTAEAFLTSLGNGETHFTFQTFDDNQERYNRSLARIFHGTLNEHKDVLTQLNSNGAGIFVNVCKTDLKGRERENITGIRALFIDSDDTLPKRYHLPPSIVIQSSPMGKGHSYWLLHKTVTDLERFKPAQQALIRHYNSDKCIHNLSRVMRLPGFYHMKGEPYKVTILELNDHRYSIDDVLAGLKTGISHSIKLKERVVSELSKPTSTSGVSSLPQDELTKRLKEQLLRVTQASEGERNDTLNKAAFTLGQLVSHGLDESEARNKLTGAAMMTGLSTNEIDKTLESGLTAGKLKPYEFAKVVPKTKEGKLLAVLEDEYAPYLSWDTYAKEVLMHDVPLDIATAEAAIIRKHDLSVNINQLERQLERLARVNRFSPVKAYLENCYSTYEKMEPLLLNSLAPNIFGTTQELYTNYLKKFMVAAVARAFEPGCKVDTVLVLQSSKQGWGKTSFFTELAGHNFFDTWTKESSEKDLQLKAVKSWVLEMGEIDTIFSKRDVSQLKQFLTVQQDKFRAPYARNVETCPRHCIFVGTTNESEFLADPTGNRRFHVIKLMKPINIAWVKANRDRLWSEAVALYKSGYQWWLTDEEQKQSSELNREFESADSWEYAIVKWLAGHVEGNQSRRAPGQPFTIADVWSKCFVKDSASLDRKAQMRIAKILESKGFDKKRMRISPDIRATFWVNPNEQETLPAFTVDDKDVF